MSPNIVLDASAVIAFLMQEKGWEQVENKLSNSIISAVNYSEVIAYFIREGHDPEAVPTLIGDCLPRIIVYDSIHAEISAKLIKKTKSFGLSFGDRACLGLGIVHTLPVLTADRAWAKINVGVKILQIR